MSFEQDLRTHLQEKASGIEVPERSLEITPQSPPRIRSRVSNAFALAATVALAVGGLAYFVNATGGPAGTDEVISTFPQEAAISPSIRGLDPLVTDHEWVWQKTTGLDVSAVVPLGDGFLAFDRAGGDAGAHAQRTISGDEWVDLGYPVPRGHPQQLTNWGDQIAGVFVDARTGNPALWSSADGATWTRGTPPPTARAATKLNLLGEMDGGLLVHASYNDSDGLAEAIRATLESTYPPRDFYVEVTSSTVRVVHRLLFVEVATFDRAELGLEPRLESSEPWDLGYWWTLDLKTWRPIQPGEIAEGFDPIAVFDTGDQAQLVGRTGPKLYVSEDGIEWSPRPLASSWQLTERDGVFVLAGYGADDPLLLRSDDLRFWEPLPTPEAFDTEPNLTAIAAGESGVAGIVQAPSAIDTSQRAFRLEVESDGMTVIYDLVQGVIELVDESGDMAWRSPIFGMTQDRARYDPDTQSIAFLDETGATLATLTAGQIAEEMGPSQRAAILFSDDLDGWTVDFLPTSTDYDVTVGTTKVALVVDNEIWIGRPE